MESSYTLDQLAQGQRLRGLVPGKVVEVLFVDPIDADLFEVIYRDDSGNTGEIAVSSKNNLALEIVADSEHLPSFTADPNEFRLAAEALRIKYASLYDPLAAVNTSLVEPLPHQIRTVYQELLPRFPLRFLLADDPGAGKTIMAGLYLKELLLRSNLERAIIVAPGGLVEQWREELETKFGLDFEIFTRHHLEQFGPENVFNKFQYLIVRMDQIARNESLLQQLEDSRWDVAVVDEAHRMSARFWGGEISETKRFKLGKVLAETADNLLLMTATPHAGKEDDFQLFLQLLDSDRFAGQFRPGIHKTDTTGLMSRTVKEDMLTFEGRPLFPERRANTVVYELSPAELELYEKVTAYVREEMGRAERISLAGDSKRGKTVGFALTVLQRRLASSPEAILRSLERRETRLEQKLKELQRATSIHTMSASASGFGFSMSPQTSWDDIEKLEYLDDLHDDLSEDEQAIFEQNINEVVDLATAAQTIGELREELMVLASLIEVARAVRFKDEDRKWVELRSILLDKVLAGPTESPRKIIIFTEHRDTLDYLNDKISSLLGRNSAIVTIHGGTTRENRKLAREQFTENPETVVLIATDAAGEGLNLQRAHLMVNYDLPWNPNRIEQRFGRIHRIGQREVCHLWNLVAYQTREGEVFEKLLSKIATQSAAYNGNLFNVLGEKGAFQNRSLQELLVEAIRYGDQPEVKARLDQVIDESVAHGLHELITERSLHPEIFPNINLEQIRNQLEAARERRLQPGYIRAFFIPSFERLGGRMKRRETGRYEITRIPLILKEAATKINRLIPLPDRYERVTFDVQYQKSELGADATLIAPGHILLQAVINLTIQQLGRALKSGTVFIDRNDTERGIPHLLCTVEQKVMSGGESPRTVSHHFDYVVLDEGGIVSVEQAPPYLDFDAPSLEEAPLLEELLGQLTWTGTDYSRQIRAWAYREGLEPRLRELQNTLSADAARTESQVRERLLAEINYWDSELLRLEELEREGKSGKIKSETAFLKSKRLEERLSVRLRQIAEEKQLSAKPSSIRSFALVIPGRFLLQSTESHEPQTFSENRDEVERRAVDLVMRTERGLGRQPQEMPRNNKGFDIRSTNELGQVFFIEVKGRIEGSDTFTISANEVAFAQTQGERHRLALVSVSSDSQQFDQLRYISKAFDHFEIPDTTRSFNEEWQQYWLIGGEPH